MLLRLPGLDLLRAVAIIWVMLFHASIAGFFHSDLPLLEGIAKSGWMGVDLFFVLSGFLIGSQLLDPLARGERIRFADFYMRRALRVLPAFWVVTALYFLWPAFREAPGIAPLWQFLTFTVNLLIDYAHDRAFSHAWSLCVEEHFYLLFPLLAVYFTRRGSAPRFIALSCAMVGGGMALRGYIWLHELAPVIGADEALRDFGQRFIEDIYYPTYTRLDGLFAGVVLAALKAYRPATWMQWQARANVVLLGGLLLAAIAIGFFQHRTGLAATVVGYPLLSAGLGMLVFAGASPSGALTWVRVPGAGWIAAISYSVYLTHKAIYHLVHTLFQDQLDGHGALTLAACAIAAIVAGAALHYLIERPFLRWREQLPRPHRATPVAAAAE
jgi:peptidoglycan/LPS O-acetylase OafA/YrhL